MDMKPESTVIAFAGEDERYKAVARYAAEIASAEDARLVLYDVDAAGLQAPLPTAWSAEGTQEHFDSGLLTGAMLEGLGRKELARQVEVQAAKGIETFGWLPEKKSLDSLVDYAESQDAGLIVVPAHANHRALIDILRGRDTKEMADSTPISVAVVDENNQVEIH